MGTSLVDHDRSRLGRARIALIAVAAAAGAKVASSPTSIPLMLAITLATQMLVVKSRARELGGVAGSSSRRLSRSARRS